MKILSIRDKLVLYSSMIICIVAVANTVGTFINERNQSLRNYQHEAMRVAQMIAPNIAGYITTSQYPSIEQELDKLKINPEINNAIILDKNGKMIADIRTVNDQNRSKRQYFQPFMKQVLQNSNFSTYIGKSVMVVGGPLFNKNEVIGYLYIQYSLAQEFERVRETLFINLLILSLSLILGLILARILSNNFTKPILELINLTHKISSGSKDITFPEQLGNEFGVLSQALKVMIQNLFQIYEKLEESTIELDKKVKERTKDLEKAIQEAKEANEEKSRFLANVSHEIRTPMNGIVGTASLLKSTKLDHEQLKYLDIMQLSAETLLNLINDILDLSKIESGKLEVEQIPFSVRKITLDVMDILAYRVHEKGLDFGCIISPQCPTSVIGDPNRVRQILLNLITNAIKFTNQGHIKINIEVEKDLDSCIILKFIVQDTGIGIPSSKVDKLFKSFSQVDASTTRHYGGTGLGLAISKKLSQMMGGDIGVISEANYGSTFWFTVKFKKDPKAQAIVYAPILKGKSILILEDNALNLEILTSYLKSYDIAPKITRKESITISALQQTQATALYDAVLLSEHLVSPTIMNEIKVYALKYDIPVLLLSHQHQVHEFKNRYQLKTCELISLPIKENDLYTALLHAFGEMQIALPTQNVGHEIKSIPGVNDIHVLIVDDNLISQQVSVKLLEKMGFLVHGANNGVEALEAIEVIPFDLILMDCQMPEMDGFEATRVLRQNPKYTTLPIIALTANALSSDKEACLAAGMNDFISKPVTTESLTSVLEKYLPVIIENKELKKGSRQSGT